jgi:hypothetical protein
MNSMRTTISIDNHLLNAAKERAAARGLTLGQYVEESIRKSLVRSESPRVEPEIPTFSGGTGMRPGIDPRSNQALYDALDASGDLK